jgi:tetratricopeptide (TPR) repeat protein
VPAEKFDEKGHKLVFSQSFYRSFLLSFRDTERRSAMNKILVLGYLILTVPLSGAVLAHEDRPGVRPPDPANVYGGQLGTVTLPFSCNEAASEQAKRGLALLHHMTYVGSRAAFVAVATIDPDCAMGYWGQAMSYIHPLWSDPPSEGDFENGKALAVEAMKRAKTEQEKAHVAAAEAYYAQGRNRTEGANLIAFEEGWRKVYEQFPGDLEAASFYALAHMATANPADKSYVKQKQSAEITQQVLERIPDHPGGHHYTIHALDYAPLASEALEVARSYGKIAPEVPHALHMPAHIFTRLGVWEESIVMNRRSADAARKHPADGKISLHYLHALDYLTYAYLQRGDDAAAAKVLDEMTALEGPYQTHVASAYSFAAVPARIALERQQWAKAVTLKAQTPNDYPWEINPAMEAITYFANGLGAARSGDPATARRAIDALTTLQERAAETSAYWGKQIEIQRLSVEAWLTYLGEDTDAALEIMRQAAAKEAATEKHPVTPGEILPAHELLADMLFEMNRYQEAQTYYLATLERSPNRFNSLYGAGRAAELGGDPASAARHYRKLTEVVAADSERSRVQHARAYLADQ